MLWKGSADMVRKKEGKSPTNVASIKNEYVRSLQEKKDRRRAQKTGLHRRLTVFAIIAVVILSVLTHTFINQKNILAAKEEEKQVLLTELADKEEEHVLLTGQLAKLNDDEYIAKLARQEYFLSDKNEIIFSLPKKDENVKKKEAKKE